MDIQFYETFLEVATTLNFRAASENLKVVQSTVSNRIQALEDFYGKTLFNRSNKKVTLTQTGKIVLPYAERIVKLHKEAVDMTRISNGKECLLKVGVDKGLYNKNLLGTLRRFSDTHSDIALDIEVLDSKTVLSGLSDGNLDIGFVYNKANINNLEFLPHEKDHFVFVIDKDLDMDRDNITKKSILELDLVKTDYGKKFDHWLTQIVPEDFAYAVKLSKGANPVDHMTGMKKAGFILESELIKTCMDTEVEAVRVKGIDMPYFQSYFVYKSSGERKDQVTKFMEILNLQK